MLQQFRTYVLPIAMLLGFIFHEFLEKCNDLVPYLLFSMLFISFCSINLKEIRFTMLNVWLLLIQMVASVGIFFLIREVDEILAQGMMMCILAPTATSTVVIGGMLGGDKLTITTQTLLCNLAVAIEVPLLFSWVGSSEIHFWHSFTTILLKMIPLLVIPLVLSVILNLVATKIQEKIKQWQNLSFYLWSITLTIVIGRTINFIYQQKQIRPMLLVSLAVSSLMICLIQFPLGRLIGKKYKDTVAGGQLLGQKNIALAIWMTQMYLEPIASMAPATYSIWQNIINSYQLWRKRKKDMADKVR